MPTTVIYKVRRFGKKGFTLIELLISLTLLIALVSILWSLIRIYLVYYSTGTARAERSQLVRSISQLLSEDLGAAIQDPVHPLPESYSSEDSVRRFGLSGSSTSIRIDVVQINPIQTVESSYVRKAAAGPVQSHAPQVPELKTVYYDFHPLSPFPSLSGTDVNTVRSSGLTRRELSFEAPSDSPALEMPSDSLFSNESGLIQTKAVGTDPSQQGFQSLDESSQPSFPPVGNIAPPFTGSGVSANSANSSTSAAGPSSAHQQLQNDTDQLMWAPEVVDCRFRYSDGTRWSDSWDSIERGGLPVAIEATLLLLPIPDLDKVRQSPLLARLQTSTAVSSKEKNQPEEKTLDAAQAVGTDNFLLIPAPSPGLTPENPAFNTNDTGSINWETLAAQLDISAPVEQKIVAYLATSPLRKSVSIQRPAAPPIKKKEPVSAQMQTPVLQQSELPKQSEQTIVPSTPLLTAPQETVPKPPVPKPTKKSQEWIRSSR